MEDNPTLSRVHIDKIRSVAQLRSVRRGEVLYAPSHPDVPLFIVLEGTVSITRAGEDEKVLGTSDQPVGFGFGFWLKLILCRKLVKDSRGLGLYSPRRPVYGRCGHTTPLVGPAACG
jgi:CRP-like cAMP-binding protein